ncbi:MAG TPA: ATP-dependent DNA ligase, partial [Thermoanaerobaculia bacterium]
MKKADRVQTAAVPAEALEGEFPEIGLPVQPPFPPMEAKSAERLPAAGRWLYEPKWDGFRCLAFRKGTDLALQSKAGQPLDRYFPELRAAFLALPVNTFVLDGEIIIQGVGGGLDFDALLQRIHPAESRIRKLSKETPASFYAFDLLVDDQGKPLVELPLAERRERLEKLLGKIPEGSIHLSPSIADRSQAERWMKELGGAGL